MGKNPVQVPISFPMAEWKVYLELYRSWKDDLLESVSLHFGSRAAGGFGSPIEA